MSRSHGKRHRSTELNPPNAATKAGRGNLIYTENKRKRGKRKRFSPRTLRFLTIQILLFSSRFPAVLCALNQRHAYEKPLMAIYTLKATFYTADKRTGRKCVNRHVRVPRTGQYVKKSLFRAGHLNGDSRTLQNYSMEHSSPPQANNYSASQEIPKRFS